MTAAVLAVCALAAGALAGPAVATVDDVLVIGDSLGVGTESDLERELAGVAVTTDARVGRGSAEGVEVLAAALRPEHDVVVFALGSNDDPALAQRLRENLETVRSLAGNRCVVVSTVAVSDYSGVSDDPLNGAIRTFAAADPRARVVEWEDAVATEPGLLTDGAHATPEGYALRAALIADAIGSCAAASADGGDGIPNPDPDALAEGRTRPRDPEPPRQPRRIGRAQAIGVLADAIASRIAIGALGAAP